MLFAFASLPAMAFGQSAGPTDPFRIPDIKTTTCTVIDKPDLVVGTIGFEFNVEDDPERFNDRTINAEFDSAGKPRLVFIVSDVEVPGKGVSEQIIILQVRPDGSISVLDLQERQPPRPSSAGANTVPKGSTSMQPKDVIKAMQLTTWLWSHRCGTASS
jgi:hypothetical protein